MTPAATSSKGGEAGRGVEVAPATQEARALGDTVTARRAVGEAGWSTGEAIALASDGRGRSRPAPATTLVSAG